MAETTTYLIEFENKKKQKITVPASWKVTFGPAVVAPTGGRGTFQGKMPMALRFYESKENQRAIFTQVANFRDTSIEIEEEVQNVQEKTGYTEVDGRRKATTFQVRTKEWVNPDMESDPSEHPALPTWEEGD